MPIIYTYPTKLPAVDDWILISDVSETNPKNATRKCTVSDILAMGTGEDYDLNAGAKVTGPPDYIPLNLTSTSGTDDSLVKLTEGTNITLTRNSATEITIDAAGGGGTMSQWSVRDDDDDDGVVTGTNNFVKFVAATGALSTNLTGTGTTVDPFVMTITSPDTDTTYSAMDTTTLGLGKLRYARDATPAAEGLSIMASRTYGVTDNASNQLVVNVPWTDTDTTYNVATQVTNGLVRLGSNTTLTQTYETGVTGEVNKTYPVQLNAANQMAVSVPWTAGGAVTEVLPTAFTPVLMTQGDGTLGPTVIADINYVTRVAQYYVLNNHVYIDFYFKFQSNIASAVPITRTLGIGVYDGGSLEPLSDLAGLSLLKEVQTNNATVTISQAEAYIIATSLRDTGEWTMMPQSGRLGKYTAVVPDLPFAWLCGHKYVAANILQTDYDPTTWITLTVDEGDNPENYAILAGSINAILIPS